MPDPRSFFDSFVESPGDEWRKLCEFAERQPREYFVLATLVARSGSSFLRPGARLLIGSDGSFTGVLSGGCLEESVAKEAVLLARTGDTRRLEVDMRAHFGCAGALTILLEDLSSSELLPAIHRELKARRTFLLRTNGSGTVIDDGIVAPEDSLDLVQRVLPCSRLLIAGGGPDAKALGALGRVLGWDVCAWPDSGETVPSPDERTALVVMNHRFAHDLRDLRAGLEAGYGYIGLLGPRRRQTELLEALDDPALILSRTADLFAPAGLAIGGDSPEAVALSIASEIQAVWAGREVPHLRDRRGRIHD